MITTLNGVKIKIELSEKKEKKLKATFVNKETGNENTIHFGDLAYQHYYDKSKLLNKSLNHKDKKRRALYRLRHYKDIKDLKKYEITAGLLSMVILW
jgi:hypothetical protein